MKYIETTVKSHVQLASDIFVIEVDRQEMSANPGQFFMLKAWQEELPLMRPISIYKITENSLFFMYRIVGKGTLLLQKLTAGDNMALLGPLGNGFPCETTTGKIALVGGGVGIPPLYETAKTLQRIGNKVDVYLGFKNETFAIEEFESICHHVYVTTENGSAGKCGFITDIIPISQYDAVFACGPEVMMTTIADRCFEQNVKCWLSMEKRMGCGIGACLVCNCKTNKGMLRTCKDGPVFPIELFF